MQQIKSATQFYTSTLLNLSQNLEQLKKRSASIAWFRFFVFISTSFCIYELRKESLLLIAVTTIAGLSLFLWLLSLSADTKKKAINTTFLIDINKEELEILNNNYFHRAEGNEFKQLAHNYENDVDVFGKASLYQYINRCSSEQGKSLLAKHLLTPQPTNFILQQQQAVKELSSENKWIQQFTAYGLLNRISLKTQEKINSWLHEKQTSFTWEGWKWFINLYSIVTVSSLILYILNIIQSSLFYPLTFVYFLFAIYQSKKIHATYTLLSRIVDEVATLYNQLKWLEEKAFENDYFNSLKLELVNNTQSKASAEILALKNILDRFDMRLNVFLFYFLNSFLLWDTRQMLALLNWKKRNAEVINHWFETIAATEVSISLAILSFNQPSFCFPVISNHHFEFEAVEMGHPLIPSTKRVNNNFSFSGAGKTALITGSNMGGKSTFLRSIGTNTILALMGAPVCAKGFTISNVELMSSMRIADNLAESTSTFYAELKKLQTIIEAVKQERKVFILLDEILRGTNSLDRHTGSKALIQQLIQQNAVAIIATHDVELAQLENSFPSAISNFHFDVQVANEELFFDYKLKTGICKSMNASILMKKIGIEINA
jgi:hypothetical protein